MGEVDVCDKIVIENKKIKRKYGNKEIFFT